MHTLNAESPLNPLDAYSQHPPTIKQISHIHEKDIGWNKYFGLIHTCQSCSLVTCHLQGKMFWSYWYRIKMNFNLLAISNTSVVWTPPQDEAYWMLQCRIFFSGSIFNWTNRITWLPSRSELSSQHKVKEEAFLKLFLY